MTFFGFIVEWFGAFHLIYLISNWDEEKDYIERRKSNNYNPCCCSAQKDDDDEDADDLEEELDKQVTYDLLKDMFIDQKAKHQAIF